MTLPKRMYRDPVLVALADEDWEIQQGLKKTKGCAVCAFRGEQIFDKHTCQLGYAPWYGKPYCGAWRMDN